jgi:hypothetical protein
MAELDFNSKAINVLLPDGTEAALLGYLVRNENGEVQVMQREEADIDRGEVIEAILPSSEIRIALGGDTAREMARRRYEVERETTFCELAPWDKLSDRERASAFWGMQQFLCSAFDAAVASIRELPAEQA